MSIKQISIGIVDDHTLFRNGVATLMKEFPELDVLFEADNGENMKGYLQKGQIPQVMLMDINMPVMDGYQSAIWLRDHYPEIRVLALSMFDDEKAVMGMIKNGALGYVLKESKPREVLEAIKAVHTKGFFINELVTGKLIHNIVHKTDEPKFSKNEIEFLKFCCSELTYKEIADKMFVSPRTVDNYRESLFSKLNLKSRTGLVLYAIKNELIKL